MKKILVFFFAFSITYISAQDLLFTQYNASPLSLNPAMTGVFDGSVRVMGNYRTQWDNVIHDNAYKGYSLSIDKKIKVSEKHNVGIGFLGAKDVAGELSYGDTQGMLSFSYMHSIGQSKEAKHFIIVGQNIGVVYKSFDLTDARWPTQVMNGVFDPTLPGEDIESSLTFLDMTSGLMWISQFTSHNIFYGGLTVHHVSEPNVSFVNQEEPLSRRITIHAGGEFTFNNKLSMMPSIAYNKQGVYELLNIGSGLRRYFSSGQNHVDLQVNYLAGKYFMGGFDSNAIAFQVRSNIKGYMVGFVFEKALNGLIGAQSFEFSLGYIFGRTPGIKRMMPRF